MTDIRVTGPAAAAARTLPSGKPAAERSQAWLMELERARWQAQPRYEPGAGAAEVPARTSARPDAHVLPTQVAASLHDVPAAEDAGPPRSASSPTASPAPVAMDRASPSVATSAGQPVSPAVAPSELRVADGDSPAAEAPATARRPAPQAGAQWQTRSVHVHVGEHATAVWVRDARLMTADAVRLLDRLRPLIAEEHDAQASIQLTVNGQPVQDKRLGRS